MLEASGAVHEPVRQEVFSDVLVRFFEELPGVGSVAFETVEFDFWIHLAREVDGEEGR